LAKASVEVPEVLKGKSPEEIQKLFDTFVKTRISTKAHDKAVQLATKDLKTKYATEYKASVEKYEKVS
jgi:endonuclease III